MRRLRRYFLQRAGMENIDATDANRRRKDEVMKNVQIPYDLFVSLLRYHLMEDNDCLNEIRQGWSRNWIQWCVVVKHFCNTLFENSPGISSFKWCFPIIVGMRTDMIVPYVHISV